jgi:class 3 adenylate cyclase
MSTQTEAVRRKKVSRRLTWAIVSANVLGAFLAIFFFQLQAGEPTDIMGVNTFIVLGLILLGSFVGSALNRPLDHWYQDPDAGLPSPRVQRLALNLPLINAGLSFSMWFLAGLLNAALSWTFVDTPDSILQAVVPIFLSLAGIAGPITALLAYFVSERLWRQEIPLFFTDQRPSDVQAFRLSLRHRLLVPFILGVILMLLMTILATLAWRSAFHMETVEETRAVVKTLRNQELYLFGIGLLVIAGLSATLGRDVVDTITDLREAMQDVQSGDLNVSVRVTSNDELGDLGAGFNAMVDGLRQEEMIRKMFGRYVTPQVAEHAIAHGPKLGGQQTVATVLFSDIRNFTALTEDLPADILIDMLNRYFEAMSDAVMRHNGLINKFGGDSLLAIFGTPLNPTTHHADHAVNAAQAMLMALGRFNADQRTRDEPTLRIGIGIATGPVIAGNVGSKERMEYTVIGDTVNLASRLEALTKTRIDLVLLDEATAADVQDVPLKSLGDVQIRGKQAPVAVYTVQR